jgi:thiol:disulfide interchange protein DsbG
MIFKHYPLALGFILALLAPLAANAQTSTPATPPVDSPRLAAEDAQPQKEPPLPPALQTLSQQGGQVRYLGRAEGFDGWIAIRNGQVQYFYAAPGGSALITGLLMDGQGHLITARQVKALQDKGGSGLTALTETADSSAAPPKAELPQFKTPAEQLFSDISASNWIPLGGADAPVLYAFIDPQCPHCHDMLKDLRQNYIDNGLIQLRIIPIGFKEDTVAQAAFLLAAPDAKDRLFKYIDGDTKALPIDTTINEQGVQRNLAIMQSWHFDVTPILLYRSAKGQVKIIRGRPKSMAVLRADLPGKTKAVP